MENLISFLVENLSGIPKIINACSFYIICAGIDKIADPIIFIVTISFVYRFITKLHEEAKEKDF